MGELPNIDTELEKMVEKLVGRNMPPFHSDHLEMFGHFMGFLPKSELRQDPYAMATGTSDDGYHVDDFGCKGVEPVANQRDRAPKS